MRLPTALNWPLLSWPFSRKPKQPPLADAASQSQAPPCDSCEERATFHLTWPESGRSVREKHLCENHARSVLTAYQPDSRGTPRLPATLDGATEFEIDLIVLCEIQDEQLVYLREVGGQRFLPIVIGIFEAAALERRLKNVKFPRPLTHDAAVDILTTLGGRLVHVLVDQSIDNVWHAQLCLLQNGLRLTIDIRPSDAFMFAVLLERPIFFRNELLSPDNPAVATGKSPRAPGAEP